jgi:hypothetical protein
MEKAYFTNTPTFIYTKKYHVFAPTRPVDNVVITTKGLQGRNINILDGTMVENKGKLIPTFICS